MNQAILFPWRLAKLIALSTALLLALALSSPANAQAPDNDFIQPNNLKAELIAEGAPQPGEELMLAIHFEPVSSEWHGYWSNPGDAGLGMQLDWTLPEGWSAGEPLYPVPQRLVIAGLMNHIYEGEYAVLVPLNVPDDFQAGSSFEIALSAQWLACTDQICVPEQGTFSFSSANQTGTVDSRFSGWRAAIAPMLDSIGKFTVGEDRLRLSIPVPNAIEFSEPHVFIGNDRLVSYADPQTFYRQENALIVAIPLRDGERDVPPQVQGIIAFSEGMGVRFAADPGDVILAGERVEMASSVIEMPPLWTLLLGALAGGLILNIMPCVFPILAIKGLSLAKAGTSEAQARKDGVAYTAGVVLACVALGAIMLALRAAGEQVGWAFQLQSPGIVVGLLILATVITLNLAGSFELPSLSITHSGEPASAFSTGLLAAFVATPCTGPFMAAALGAALLLPPIPALLLFATLGLGLALPFLALGWIPAVRNKLPKPGAWMETFRKAMAIPMGITALALVWLTSRLGGQGFAVIALIVLVGVVIALLVVGRLQRAGKMAWPAFGLIAAPFLIFGAFALPSALAEPVERTPQSILSAEAFSSEALAEARASGRPVFVWFTADWCLTCKVNERIAIERETTRVAFEEAGVVAMVGDWTLRDEEITQFLTEQRVAGVPLYLWYEPGAEAEQLPQVLTPEMLSERAMRDRS